MGGNTVGILVAPGARDTVVRDNIALGNPGIQVANLRPEARAVDILNLAPAGQTTFASNTCLTGVNAPCPTITGRTSRKTAP